MNDLDAPPALKGPPPRPLLPPPDRDTPEPPPSAPARRGGSGRLLLGLGVQFNFVPNVRVEEVAQRQGRVHVSLPGTTLAFEQANIYARASGYVLKRYVDIGDRVKAGQLLAEITAFEVDH